MSYTFTTSRGDRVTIETNNYGGIPDSLNEVMSKFESVFWDFERDPYYEEVEE